MNPLENHALVTDVIHELLEHSTIHPRGVNATIISPLQARTMTLEELHHAGLKLLEQLKDYPNITILQEYVKRMGFLVENRDAS